GRRAAALPTRNRPARLRLEPANGTGPDETGTVQQPPPQPRGRAPVRPAPRPPRRLPGPAMRLTRLALLMALSTCFLRGSPMPHTEDAQQSFPRQIAKLLEGRDSAVVDAAQLTDFDWQKLCFEREDALELKFSGGGADKVFRFGYEDYFVAEPYVERSP